MKIMICGQKRIIHQKKGKFGFQLYMFFIILKLNAEIREKNYISAQLSF